MDITDTIHDLISDIWIIWKFSNKAFMRLRTCYVICTVDDIEDKMHSSSTPNDQTLQN